LRHHAAAAFLVARQARRGVLCCGLDVVPGEDLDHRVGQGTARACTGWQLIVEKRQRVGYLAEPAETSSPLGPKGAKADRADARIRASPSSKATRPSVDPARVAGPGDHLTGAQREDALLTPCLFVQELTNGNG
jgi:hypothetical protein